MLYQVHTVVRSRLQTASTSPPPSSSRQFVRDGERGETKLLSNFNSSLQSLQRDREVFFQKAGSEFSGTVGESHLGRVRRNKKEKAEEAGGSKQSWREVSSLSLTLSLSPFSAILSFVRRRLHIQFIRKCPREEREAKRALSL